MSKNINRRDFIKSGTLITAAAVLGTGDGESSLYAKAAKKSINISVANGTDRFKNTVDAVEALGGMERFLPKNGRVGLLINAPPWWKTRGSYTHPDVVLATIIMCLKAGVKEMQYIIDPADNYWDRTELSDKYKKEISLVKKCSENFINKKVPSGKSLKKVDIIKDIFDCDVFINIPVIKDHTGTGLTCNLKNMMGANSHATNQFFHKGSGSKTSYGDVGFLSQCIADLNTLISPALCIVDAGDVLTTNGPAGPGKIKKINKVIAGVNPVSVDSYCSTLLDLKPENIKMLSLAKEHKLGETDLSKLLINELKS